MRRTIVAGLGLLLVLGAACSKGTKGEGIEVTGTGRAPVTYDLLEFTISTEFRASSIQRAGEGARKAIDAVVAAFRSAGVAATDLEAGESGAYPVAGASYFSGSVGYTVRLRDLNRASATLGAALGGRKAAGSTVRWGRVYLKVTDRATELATARRAALGDAKARAQQLAQDASGKLGKVLEISVSSEPAPPPHGYPTSMLLEKDLGRLAEFLSRAKGREAVFVILKVRYELR